MTATMSGTSDVWITAEGGFISPGEPSELSEENVEVGDHKHPFASTVSHMYQPVGGAGGVTLSSKPVASNVIRQRPKEKKKKADILHSWAHSTEYNNFLEFFDPRRRSQGTSCCPRSTSCSCSLISLPSCHGHWKTLYSCSTGALGR